PTFQDLPMFSMTRKPLALALIAALPLCACQPASQQVDVDAAPIAPTAATTTFDLSSLKAGEVRFNVADLDPGIAACDDFNGHVNGAWLAANPVPSDRTTWGSFETLGERSLEVQHRLAEAAA